MTVVEDFLSAIGTGEVAAIRGLLADDVWCRALLVRELVELHDAIGTTRLFHSWYGTPDEVHLEEAAHHDVMGRTFVRYRLRLRPEWAPDTWHRVEQSGYLTVRDGRIRRIDLACTGFFVI